MIVDAKKHEVEIAIQLLEGTSESLQILNVLEYPLVDNEGLAFKFIDDCPSGFRSNRQLSRNAESVRLVGHHVW